MSTITTRSGKGSPLTNNEVDANFTNLNNDKSETTHTHTGVYEPVITKNTGFNKNLGTTAGTVAEGDHTHTEYAATTHNHDTTYVNVTGDTMTGALTATDFIGPLDGPVRFKAQNDEGSAITAGQVVYIKGISGNTPTVGLADASNSSKMPAFGLVYANANNNAAVEIVTFGTLGDIKTDYSGWSLGDTLYVSTTAGTLTNSAPAGESNLIQNIGKIQRVHGSAGSIKVGGAGRTNATPNLNDGNVFIGNASNQSVARALQIADVTNLQTELNNKADTTHTHTEYDPAGTGVAMAIALG